jgi:DNA-binding transcriptional ArsR family regulator
MPAQAPFAVFASLLGDPSRALMVHTMMDGGFHAATELAEAAGISPQTASAHFAKMVAAGLVTFEAQGRHRRYALASPRVGEAVEALGALAAGLPRRTPPRRQALAAARTCYDHLAGRLAVAMTRSLVERGLLTPEPDRFDLTPAGAVFLVERLGVDVATAQQKRRPLARCCLDWTEREPHLGGALGAALAQRCFHAGWVTRRDTSRAVDVSSRLLKNSLTQGDEP